MKCRWWENKQINTKPKKTTRMNKEKGRRRGESLVKKRREE
jgi:hypothetical protein